MEKPKPGRGITYTKHFSTVEDAMKATDSTSPREALKKLKTKGTMSARGTYMPHTGAKQKAKAARRAASIK